MGSLRSGGGRAFAADLSVSKWRASLQQDRSRLLCTGQNKTAVFRGAEGWVLVVWGCVKGHQRDKTSVRKLF
jgi:hypothetical protein